MKSSRKALILSISSDIGTALAHHFKQLGWQVAGTYRTESAAVVQLKSLGIQVVPCDLSDETSIAQACLDLSRWAVTWDALFVCPGTLEPIGCFHEVDFDEWQASLQLNLLAPLRAVRGLLPSRETGAQAVPTVLFFAGGGTNSAPVRFSAYTVSKIALIKMCEMLDAEIPDTRFVIIGPGWVRTKIHETTLAAGDRAGDAYQQTVLRLDENRFVSMDHVVACCEWAVSAPKEVVGGRNLSAAHDAWEQPDLEAALKNNPDMYKLRREGNTWRCVSV